MSAYRLISFDLCPFVQRSVIALIEKGVPYEVEYVDLNAKPEWFLAISPRGKVPVLIVEGGEPIFESAVINEYLDETAGGPRLMPDDPMRRAWCRMWIEYSSVLLGDIWRASVAETEEAARTSLQAVKDQVARMGAQVKGPFFLGEAFTLIDVAASTAMMRAKWLGEVAPEFEILPERSPAGLWTDTLLRHPSVQASIFDGMRDRFIAYMRGDRSPTLKTDPSWLGRKAV